MLLPGVKVTSLLGVANIGLAFLICSCAWADPSDRKSELRRSLDESRKTIEAILATGQCNTAADCQLLPESSATGCRPSKYIAYSRHISDEAELKEEVDIQTTLQQEYIELVGASSSCSELPPPLVGCIENQCQALSKTSSATSGAACAPSVGDMSSKIRDDLHTLTAGRYCESSDECGVIRVHTAPQCHEQRSIKLPISTHSMNVPAVDCKVYELIQALNREVSATTGNTECTHGSIWTTVGGTCLNNLCSYTAEDQN